MFFQGQEIKAFSGSSRVGFPPCHKNSVRYSNVSPTVLNEGVKIA